MLAHLFRGVYLGVKSGGIMHLLSFIAVLFVSLTAWARYPIDKAFICPEQTLNGTNNIICCDQLQGKSCQQTLDTLLTQKQQNTLTSLTEVILNQDINKSIPSCFGTSLALLDVHPADYKVYLPYDSFFAVVNEQFIEVSGEPQIGDLILLDEQGIFNVMHEHENTYGKYYVKTFKTYMAHAAVYIGHGLIAQKENAETAVATVSRLDRAVERYNWGVQQTTKTMDYAGKKTNIVVRVFRKI